MNVCLGVSAALFGMTLMTNLNGAVDYLARLDSGDTTDRGDTPKALARPVFSRLAGALFFGAGIVFTVSVASGPL